MVTNYPKLRVNFTHVKLIIVAGKNCPKIRINNTLGFFLGKEYLKLLYLKFRDELKFSKKKKEAKICLNLRKSISEFQNLIIRFFKFR